MPDGNTAATLVVASQQKETPSRVMEELTKANDKIVVITGIKHQIPYVLRVVTTQDQKEKLCAIAEEVFTEVDITLNWRTATSELSAINGLIKDQPYPLSPSMQYTLKVISELNDLTSGKFDPACFPLARFYQEQLSTGKKLSEIDSDKLKTVENATGWKTQFSIQGDQLSKNNDDAALDLDGLSKGWCVDQMIGRLKKDGFNNAFFDWGGDIKASGQHPDGRNWCAALLKPPELDTVDEFRAKYEQGTVESQYLEVIELSGDHTAVCTSGDYMQKQLTVGDGERYTHIFDPVKNRPLQVVQSGVCSMTVVGSSCMLADALATTAMLQENVDKAAAFMTEMKKRTFVGDHKVHNFLVYTRANHRLIDGSKMIRKRGDPTPADHPQKKSVGLLPATVVIVGGGLAGCSAALEALHWGAEVTLIEKEKELGGNSAKATSGINGWGTAAQQEQGIKDSEAEFERDTYFSGVGGYCDHGCVRLLSHQSAEAIRWLRQDLGVTLTVLSQLGGHSNPRTHRAPSEGGKPVPIGWLIMQHVKQALLTHAEGSNAKLKIVKNARCKNLLQVNSGEVKIPGYTRVNGVVYVDESGTETTLTADAVILATGGYANDHTEDSLLTKHCPTVCKMATTNGSFATGDGMKMGAEIGATLIDMDKIQLHPTGLIDPKDPYNHTKFLGPEALRGSGGILLSPKGNRFIDELDLRSVVTNAILKQCDKYENNPDGYNFAWLVMNQAAAEKFGSAALGFYKDTKGLIEEANGIDELGKIMGLSDTTPVEQALMAYEKACEDGICPQTGKAVFPVKISINDDKFYVARITPSLHYCMGGLQISAAAEVQMEIKNSSVFGKKKPILGLFAAGEVTGGVHGGNRLGGNSLLECVVFGRTAGERAATINRTSTVALSTDEWTTVVHRETRDTTERFGLQTCALRFSLPSQLQQSGLEIGQYITLEGVSPNGDIVSSFFSPITRPDDMGVISLLARIGGGMKDIISLARPGDLVQMKAMGGLKLTFSKKDKAVYYEGRKLAKIGLIAGGTGVAPMLQIIRATVTREEFKDLPIRLLYAANTKEEYTYREYLEQLNADHPSRFHMYKVVASPPQGWTEGLGFVTAPIIKKEMPRPTEKDILVIICGPPPMQNAVAKALKQLNYSDDQFYVYH